MLPQRRLGEAIFQIVHNVVAACGERQITTKLKSCSDVPCSHQCAWHLAGIRCLVRGDALPWPTLCYQSCIVCCSVYLMKQVCDTNTPPAYTPGTHLSFSKSWMMGTVPFGLMSRSHWGLFSKSMYSSLKGACFSASVSSALWLNGPASNQYSVAPQD